MQAKSVTTTQNIDLRNATVCRDHLHRLYKMLKRYAHQSGESAFPKTIGSLYPMVRDPAVFVCPDDKFPDPPDGSEAPPTSFRLVNDPFSRERKDVSPSRLAIVIETRAREDGHRFVLFWDGSVKDLDATVFQNLTQDSFIASH